MTAKFLIEEKTIQVKKEACKSMSALLGVDRGCSLTKVLYATEKDSEYYNLHFALFLNEHFEEALRYVYLKKEAILSSKDGKIHVTGAGCHRFADVIRKILNLEPEFIDELLTQGRGPHWLLSSFDDEEICYPEVDIGESLMGNIKMAEAVQETMDAMKKAMIKTENSKFPCIVCTVGSAGTLFRVNEAGEFSIAGSIWMAGKSFLGLGKLLLGTNKYDEIMKLASKGKRKNIDTEIKEILKEDPQSPYGFFPPSMPVFSFGKCVDNDLGLEDATKEDLAHSMVSSFCINLMNMIFSVAKALGVSKIYCCGNFFRDETMRKEMAWAQDIFAGGRNSGMSNIKYIKTGHTGVIGAIVSAKDDLGKYMKN